MANSPDSVPAAQINLFEAWKEYQQIAMHFNDLLMRLRSQSLAAVGALASVAGFAFRGDASGTPRWDALVAVFFALALFWVAIWILDFWYYNRLLLGAVDALMEIEDLSAQGQTTLSRLNLSHAIEDAVARGGPPGKRRSGAMVFYVIVLAVLILGLAESEYRVRFAP